MNQKRSYPISTLPLSNMGMHNKSTYENHYNIEVKENNSKEQSRDEK